MRFKMVFMVLSCMTLAGCSVTQTTELSKFTADMNIVKTYRSDLYDKYMKGEIVIDDVYLDETVRPAVYGVDYHAVQFVPATSVK